MFQILKLARNRLRCVDDYRAVEELVNDRSLARRLGKAGYALALNKFTRERSAEAFDGLFGSLCSKLPEHD